MSKSRGRSMIAGNRSWISWKEAGKPLSYAGNVMAASETLYERLRRLGVEDPKTARIVFLEAFEANNNDLPEFLEHLRRPGEARLRQVVANAVRAHPGKKRL